MEIKVQSKKELCMRVSMSGLDCKLAPGSCSLGNDKVMINMNVVFRTSFSGSSASGLVIEAGSLCQSG